MNNNTSSSSTGRKAVPEAREALNRFKYEVAGEIGVPLKQGYNGDLTSAQNGSVGGYMVKKICPIRMFSYERPNGGSSKEKTTVCYIIDSVSFHNVESC